MEALLDFALPTDVSGRMWVVVVDKCRPNTARCAFGWHWTRRGIVQGQQSILPGTAKVSAFWESFIAWHRHPLIINCFGRDYQPWHLRYGQLRIVQLRISVAAVAC